jgi:hypothetical protein
MRNSFALMITLIALSVSAVPVSAQDGTPPAPSAAVVTGALVNRTTGEPGPEGIELMLHAWDEAGVDRGMVHGVSGPGGEFEITEVPVEAGLFYVVMAIYHNASYLSETFVADEQGQLPEFEVPIYETTTDDGEISIDLMHLVLGSGQGGLTVGEYYALSNRGDRTVAEAVTLEDGSMATMFLGLPTGAASVNFPSSPDRFRLFGEGIADTRPLPPGVGGSQVIVSYVLQYEDGLVLQRILPFATERVNVFLPQSLGLNLELKDAEYMGVETLGSVPEDYQVYQLGPLKRGDRIELQFSGELAPPTLVQGVQQALPPESATPSQLMVGFALLGAALILGGAWWMWRLRALEEEEPLEQDPGTVYPS